MTGRLKKRFAIRIQLLVGALLLLSAVLASAQTRADDTIRVDTELVAFEVSVTDRAGRPVRGLGARNFKVYDNGVERPVDFFEPVRRVDGNRPLSIVFALDISGSMTDEELGQLRNALRGFVTRVANKQSYFAVMTFGMEVKTLQSFTNKTDKLDKTFSRLKRDDDGLSTHAYDAVDAAVRLLEKKSPPTVRSQIPRRAVVLITDGFPVGDIVSPKTVIERANAAETSVHTILLPSFSRLQGTKKPLLTLLEASGLIEKTGGRTFYVNDQNFEPLFKSLEEEITSTYVVAFYPGTNVPRDGKSRTVRIVADNGLTVRQNREAYQLR